MPYVYEDQSRGSPFFLDRLRSSSSDVATEQFAQAFEENPIFAAYRWYSLAEDHRTGKRLTKAEAEARLLDRGLSGQIQIDDSGITENALDTLASRKLVELRRQEIFARSQGGFGQGLRGFGVSFFTAMSDPVNVATAFLPVIGKTRYARWLSRTKNPLERAGVRAGVGAIEGTAGAAMVEPLIYGSRTAEQADYDSVDSLVNASFGAVFGGALHPTFGGVSDVRRGFRLKKLLETRAARGIGPSAPKFRLISLNDATPDQLAGIRDRLKESMESGETGDRAVATEYLGRVIDDNGMERSFVLNRKGEVVAGISTRLDAGSNSIYWNNLGSVEPGAGRFLVKQLIEKARKSGIEKIRLIARPGSEGFHQKMGFTEINPQLPGWMGFDLVPPRTREIARVSEAVEQVANDEEVNVVKFPSKDLPPRIVFEKNTDETWPQAITRIADENQYPAEPVHDLYEMYLEDGLDEQQAAIAALDEAELLPDSAYKGNFDPTQETLEAWGVIADHQPPELRIIEGTRGPDPEIEESIRLANETPKEVEENPADAIDEDLANAEAELRATEDELEIKEPDPELEELDEAVKKANDWSKSAEIAVSCLTKGIE